MNTQKPKLSYEEVMQIINERLIVMDEKMDELAAREQKDEERLVNVKNGGVWQQIKKRLVIGQK